MRHFHAVEFVIHAAELLDVDPVVKYASLSLFADRFTASLESFIGGNVKRHWLLSPVRDSNLQLFALISIWTSSKMNMSKPLSVKTLKSLGDEVIMEQHFTLRDYFEAALWHDDWRQTDPTQALNFEIGCASNAFAILKELFIQLKGVAKVGELIDFHACMDIMDLLYEKEETSRLYLSPVSLAASVLVCSYIITVPKQSWEFPILPWVKFATSCSEEYIQGLVKVILQHIFADLLSYGNRRCGNVQVGTIKDKNSLWVTSVSRWSVYCNPDLEVVIIKATSHDETRINYKSVQLVYAGIRTSPAFNLKLLIWSLSYRMDRTWSWVVAVKGLMLLHGIFCCKIPALDKIGRFPFHLSNFSHSHSSVSKTWGYDAFVRAYFTFLDHKSMFLCTHRDPKSRIRLKELRKDRPIMGDIQMLLKAQFLLDSLLQIRPQMECMKRVCLIREAMDCVIIEIFDMYSNVCSFIAGVLSKIYSATRVEALMALSVLRQANVHGDELSRYFELCRSMGVLNVSEFLKVERIPEEDIREVKRIVNEISSGHKNQEAEKAIVPVGQKAIVPVVQSMALTTVITDKWEFSRM